MKIVIQTQYCENYAAHNEDFVPGVSEDYWKFKGGDTYIVNNVSVEQAQTEGFWTELESMVTYSNDASKEYILHMECIDDVDFSLQDHVQEWETPTYIAYSFGEFVATKKTLNEEFGYMNPAIKSKFESWTMGPNQERKDYESSFEMQDGMLLAYNELETYLTQVA